LLWAIRFEVPTSLIDSLPLPQRLALAYAPGASKPAILGLFAFDARLAQAIRQASEPIMAQMRLAWWRDQLRLAPQQRERSDELICALDLFAGEEQALLGLIDGWEGLLSDRLDIAAFAMARADAFAALARILRLPEWAENAARAGHRYALADLAANLGKDEEKRSVLERAGEGGRIALPKALRSLAVLDGLARCSLAKGGAPLLEGLGTMLRAIRLGLFGR
jgi:phytoene synthase